MSDKKPKKETTETPWTQRASTRVGAAALAAAGLLGGYFATRPDAESGGVSPEAARPAGDDPQQPALDGLPPPPPLAGTGETASGPGRHAAAETEKKTSAAVGKFIRIPVEDFINNRFGFVPAPGGYMLQATPLELLSGAGETTLNIPRSAFEVTDAASLEKARSDLRFNLEKLGDLLTSSHEEKTVNVRNTSGVAGAPVDVVLVRPGEQAVFAIGLGPKDSALPQSLRKTADLPAALWKELDDIISRQPAATFIREMLIDPNTHKKDTTALRALARLMALSDEDRAAAILAFRRSQIEQAGAILRQMSRHTPEEILTRDLIVKLKTYFETLASEGIKQYDAMWPINSETLKTTTYAKMPDVRVVPPATGGISVTEDDKQIALSVFRGRLSPELTGVFNGLTLPQLQAEIEDQARRAVEEHPRLQKWANGRPLTERQKQVLNVFLEKMDENSTVQQLNPNLRRAMTLFHKSVTAGEYEGLRHLTPQQLQMLMDRVVATDVHAAGGVEAVVAAVADIEKPVSPRVLNLMATHANDLSNWLNDAGPDSNLFYLSHIVDLQERVGQLAKASGGKPGSLLLDIWHEQGDHALLAVQTNLPKGPIVSPPQHINEALGNLSQLLRDAQGGVSLIGSGREIESPVERARWFLGRSPQKAELKPPVASSTLGALRNLEPGDRKLVEAALSPPSEKSDFTFSPAPDASAGRWRVLDVRAEPGRGQGR